MGPLGLAVEILRNVLGMAWMIAWGLVLGFAISGVIQAFVPTGAVTGRLGEARPGPLALATGLGAASSSCSYAAAAMSKSLLQKGAHLVNATAFLFASTNLVFEIGLVLWTLMGWRFVAAEFFGGVLLILVVAVLLKWFAPARLAARMREHLEEATGGHEGHHHGGGETLPWSRLATREGLSAAGRRFVMDWRMVGRDIVLGVVIAGILAAVVPPEWWREVFLSAGGGAPGFWVRVENAVVGPVIAILSFVCSVGNIPLAAVLWSGGISFGGVIAFIYADLVTIPMVLVYRRYYGWGPALVYAAYLLATMVITALVVETVFHAVGLAPEAVARAPVTGDYFAWDRTTALNLVFLPLGIALAWLGTRPEPADS